MLRFWRLYLIKDVMCSFSWVRAQGWVALHRSGALIDPFFRWKPHMIGSWLQCGGWLWSSLFLFPLSHKPVPHIVILYIKLICDFFLLYENNDPWWEEHSCRDFTSPFAMVLHSCLGCTVTWKCALISYGTMDWFLHKDWHISCFYHQCSPTF